MKGGRNRLNQIEEKPAAQPPKRNDGKKGATSSLSSANNTTKTNKNSHSSSGAKATESSSKSSPAASSSNVINATHITATATPTSDSDNVTVTSKSKAASVENWKKQRQEQQREILAKQQEPLRFASAAAKNSSASASSPHISSIPGPGAMGNNKKKNRSNAGSGLSHAEFPSLSRPEPVAPAPKQPKQPKKAKDVVKKPDPVPEPTSASENSEDEDDEEEEKEQHEEEEQEEEQVSREVRDAADEDQDENWTTVNTQSRSGGIDFSKPMDPWVAQQQRAKQERIAAADPHGEQQAQFARVLSIKPTVKEDRIREAVPDGFSVQKTRTGGSSGGSSYQSAEVTKKQRENLAKAAKKKEDKAAMDAMQEKRRQEHMRQVKAEKMKEFYRSQSKKQAPYVESRWDVPKNTAPSSSAVSGAPKRQGVPIVVPQTERRPSSYKLETSNPALLTGFRAGGIIKRKPSISQQGQRAISPTFNGSRGDKHKIKKVAALNDDDYELVGMAPGYAKALKDKQKTRALEYVLLSDEDEHKDTKTVKRKKTVETSPGFGPLSTPATIGGPLLAAIRKYSTPSGPLSKPAAIAPARTTSAYTSTTSSGSVASTSDTASSASASVLTTPPSSRVKHLSTAHSPLSEKATALGMGTFPQASLSAVRCERITEFTNTGMTIQFGPERLIINIDKNVTKIGHDVLKVVEVFFDGDPKVLVISLCEKLPESSILSEFYDPAPHSGKARKITLLCSCDSAIIQGYCKRLSKKSIQVKPLSTDAVARILSTTVVRSPTETSSSSHHSSATAPSVTAKPLAKLDRHTSPRRTSQLHDTLFLFPFKNSAKSKSIAVHVEDISRLDEGEFLNDTLIEFGLKYIYSNLEALDPELADQTYIFNSFFYQRLLAKPGKGMSSSYDAIKSWTNKIDIFSKKFIIVPIHEHMHWYLAIITNPGLLLKGADVTEAHSDASSKASSSSELENTSTAASPADSDPASPSATDESSKPSNVATTERRIEGLFSAVDRLLTSRKTSILNDERPVVRRSSRSTSSAVPVDAEEKPYILVLDSLGGIHPTVTKTLRSYLQQELSARKNIVKSIDPNTIPGKHAKAPQQKNHCDCGLFLLHYAEVFLKHPGQLLDAIVNNKRDEANKYWAVEELAHKREQYREIVLSLTEEYSAFQGRP
ncbi:unnamed protein product [Mortierella alpina]